MYLDFNPQVRCDVRSMLDYFDRVSDVVGDKVFKDFTTRIEQIRNNPYQFPPFRTVFRKAPLKCYPFDIVYKVTGDKIRILVFRHQERNDNFGMSRR